MVLHVHMSVLFLPAGPLMAVIDAQSAAALTTMDFIRNVGFDENGDARNVSFIYDRLNSTSGEIESKTLTVPLLTIIPIPYIRVSRLSL